MSQKISYAQNREDIILSGFFDDEEKGFYVDVGASHPSKLSVTKYFYKKGWRGVNIEPIPWLHDLLEKERPKDINLRIGISDKSGDLTLREYPNADGLSTFSTEMQDAYVDSKNKTITNNYVDYSVSVVPISDVFKMHSVSDINFMKIDVEGYEYEVIASNDWDKYRPKVLCIESNHMVKDWRPLLKKYGYEYVFFDGLNEYYTDKEHPEIAEKFSYEDAILNYTIIPAEVSEKLETNELEISTKTRELEKSNLVNEELIRDNQRLNIDNIDLKAALENIKEERQKLVKNSKKAQFLNKNLQEELSSQQTLNAESNNRINSLESEYEIVLCHARHLENEILHSRRPRSLILLLIKCLDNRVLAEIQKLNITNPRYGDVFISADILRLKDKDEIINQVRLHDFMNLYNVEPAPTARYRIASKLYLLPTRFTYKAIRKLLFFIKGNKK